MKVLRLLEGLTSDELRLVLVLGPGSFVTASTLGTINVGLPAIQHEFGVSLSALKWVSIMGGIMMASLSLCFGRIGDLVGRKRVYRAGMIVYAVGSGLAAAAMSFPNLLVVRVFMATGIAMTVPLAAAIVASAVRPERRGQAIGLLASFAAAGQLAGPSLGGFALDLFGWRGVFLANMAVAGALSVAQHFFLRGDDVRGHEPFDYWGTLLLLLGYPALLVGLSLGPRSGWDTPLTLGCFGVGAVGMAAFFFRETHFATPIFHFAFFRSLPFSIAMFTLVVASFVQSPITLFTPIYLQNVLSVKAVVVGVIMMALPISTFFAGPLGGRLADRYNPRLVAGAGMAVTFLAVFFYARLGVGTPVAFVLLPLILVGVGGGLFRPANQVAVFATMEPRHFGSLSAMLSSLGALAGTLGATITVAINESRSSVTDHAAFASAQQFTFTTLLPLLLIAVFVSLIGRRQPAAAGGELAPATAAAGGPGPVR
jgi:EmrB/QacA subfamily drug resistance transporter